jgi:Leucine-rich repeat (LRR) protein
MTLFAALGGPGWLNSSGWGGSDPVCSWYGVVCEGGGALADVPGPEAAPFAAALPPGSVTRLLLGGNNVSGLLPSALCSLPSLWAAVFDENPLLRGFAGSPSRSSPFPACPTPPHLLSLLGTGIDQNFTDLADGVFGPWFNASGGLGSLRHLRIGGPRLVGDGPLPPSLPPNLLRLHVEDAPRLRPGPLEPSHVAAYPELQSLVLVNAGVTGGLDSVCAASASAVEVAVVKTAGSTGAEEPSLTFPACLWRMPRLARLVVSGLSLVGPLPDPSLAAGGLGPSSVLTALSLADNRIASGLAALVDPAALPSLAYLDVRMNEFADEAAGGVAASLGRLLADGRLVGLWADNSRFDGELPASLCAGSGGTRLRFLSATHAGLTGPIPSLEGCTALEELSLHVNRLSGPMPPLPRIALAADGGWANSSSSSPHPALRVLDIADNSLSGPFPLLGALNLPNLTVLDVSANDFVGEMPTQEEWDGVLSRPVLAAYLVGGNRFTGAHPSLENFTALAVLSLSGNLFNGTLPALPTAAHAAAVGSPPALRFVEADGCNFNGSFYLQFKNATTDFPALTHLSLARNHFGGKFPQALFEHASLETLDVSDNSLVNIECPFGIDVVIPNRRIRTVRFSNNPTIKNVYVPGELGEEELGARRAQLDWSTLRFPDALLGCFVAGFINTDVEEIHVRNCAGFGAIPYALSEMPRLRVLDAGENELHDDPGNVWMARADVLTLQGAPASLVTFETVLTTYVPQPFFPSLATLLLDDNRLVGTLQSWLSVFSVIPSLRHLDLSDNLLLIGPVSTWDGLFLATSVRGATSAGVRQDFTAAAAPVAATRTMTASNMTTGPSAEGEDITAVTVPASVPSSNRTDDRVLYGLISDVDVLSTRFLAPTLFPSLETLSLARLPEVTGALPTLLPKRLLDLDISGCPGLTGPVPDSYSQLTTLRARGTTGLRGPVRRGGDPGGPGRSDEAEGAECVGERSFGWDSGFRFEWFGPNYSTVALACHPALENAGKLDGSAVELPWTALYRPGPRLPCFVRCSPEASIPTGPDGSAPLDCTCVGVFSPGRVIDLELGYDGWQRCGCNPGWYGGGCSCTRCPFPSRTPDVGFQILEGCQCPPGTVARTVRDPDTLLVTELSCVPCPLGSFTGAWGVTEENGSCSACPLHSTTPREGATSFAECTCSPGFFPVPVNVSSDGGGGSGGTIIFRRAAAEDLDRVTDSDPAGAPSSPSRRLAAPTPGPQAPPPGESRYRCAPCPANTYKPGPGALGCQVCPPATFSHPGASTCTRCADGGVSCAGGRAAFRPGWWTDQRTAVLVPAADLAAPTDAAGSEGEDPAGFFGPTAGATRPIPATAVESAATQEPGARARARILPDTAASPLTPDASLRLVPAPNSTLVRCIDPSACLVTADGAELFCAPGTTGPLCGSCEAGYFPSIFGAAGCHACPDAWWSVLGTILRVLAGVFLMSLHAWTARQDPRNRVAQRLITVASATRIAYLHAETIHILSFNALVVSSIPAASVALIQNADLYAIAIALRCMGGEGAAGGPAGAFSVTSPRSTLNGAVAAFLFIIVVGTAAVLFGFLQMLGGASSTADNLRFAFADTLLRSIVLQPGILAFLVASARCTDVPGAPGLSTTQRVLVADTAVSCDDGALTGLSAATVWGLVLGTPLATVVVISSLLRLRSARRVRTGGGGGAGLVARLEEGISRLRVAAASRLFPDEAYKGGDEDGEGEPAGKAVDGGQRPLSRSSSPSPSPSPSPTTVVLPAIPDLTLPSVYRSWAPFIVGLRTLPEATHVGRYTVPGRAFEGIWWPIWTLARFLAINAALGSSIDPAEQLLWVAVAVGAALLVHVRMRAHADPRICALEVASLTVTFLSVCCALCTDARAFGGGGGGGMGTAAADAAAAAAAAATGSPSATGVIAAALNALFFVAVSALVLREMVVWRRMRLMMGMGLAAQQPHRRQATTAT